MAALQGQLGKPQESSHEALAGTEAEDHPRTPDTQVPSDERAISPRTRPMVAIPNGDTQATVPTQTDEALAVILMGVTGSGKSTFISLLADQDVKVGHGLESSTIDTQMYSFKYNETKTVVLVDTPGFDDTTRSDADILRDIAFFLASLHMKKAKIAGIVYLHRITDPRISGSAMKNLRVLQKLCGSHSFGSIVLTTTMWEDVELDPEAERLAVKRESELQKPAFWGTMLQQGSQMVRHSGKAESARGIVARLVDKDIHVELDIQHELVVEQKTLEETEAGRYVQKEILEAKKKYERELVELQESMEEAIQEKDQETLRLIQLEKEVVQVKAAEHERARQRLNTDMRQLAQERDFEYGNLDRAVEEEVLEIGPCLDNFKVDRRLREVELELEEHKRRFAELHMLSEIHTEAQVHNREFFSKTVERVYEERERDLQRQLKHYRRMRGEKHGGQGTTWIKQLSSMFGFADQGSARYRSRDRAEDLAY